MSRPKNPCPFSATGARRLSTRNSLFWFAGAWVQTKDVSCFVHIVEADQATPPEAIGLEGFNSKGFWQRSSSGQWGPDHALDWPAHPSALLAIQIPRFRWPFQGLTPI